jgi:hypothetical protein
VIKFKFKETNSIISLQKSSNKSVINPIADAANFDDYKVPNNFFKNIVYDQSSIQKLESSIRKIINSHQNILLQADLPEQIDIEFLRVSRLKQLLHHFSKNKIDEPYAESSQKASYSSEAPVIKIATDFIKDFSDDNREKFGHKFLDTLRSNFADSNKDKTKEIITELTFTHELGHIAFNSKIKHTFLKYGYEIKGEKLPNFKRAARLINESFADGFCAYVTNIDFPNDNIIEKYQNVRLSTKTEVKDNISYYNISQVFNSLNGISKINAIDDIFEIALQNGLNVVKEKISQSPIFEAKLKKDLAILDSNNIFQYNNNESVVKNLEQNLRQQLKEQFSPLFVKPKEKEECIYNIGFILNKFRNNNSEKDNKIKPK